VWAGVLIWRGIVVASSGGFRFQWHVQVNERGLENQYRHSQIAIFWNSLKLFDSLEL